MDNTKEARIELVRSWLRDGSLQQSDLIDACHAECDGATFAEVAEADHLYADDNISVDTNALTSRDDEGLWVMGWLWVPAPEQDETEEAAP